MSRPLINKLPFLAIILTTLLLSGCANIPSGAESANAKVSVGIERMAADTQTILNAYRDSLRLAIQSEFERIHDEAEKATRIKRGVATGTPLDDEQRQEVSGIVLITFEKAYQLVDNKIAEASTIIRENAVTVKSANDDITRLLASAGRIGIARSEIISTVKSLIPLPDVPNLIDQTKDLAL